MASRGVKKSTLLTNLDVSLTPAERKQRELDEKNDALIQGAIEQSKKDGPSIDMLTSDKQEWSTTYDRLAEQEAYAAGDKTSLIPLAVKVGPQYPGGFHWVLSDADYELVAAGFACGYCLDTYRGVWRPACPTCGMDRDVVL